MAAQLFGSVRGAYTGSIADRKGAFEAADGGTLFLNEIGDMSPVLQAKLLTALDKQTIVRVGSNRQIRVDVRVLAATNMDLPAMMQSGRFRPELYRRIKCLEITVPPLRKRSCDILLLASYFLEQQAPRPLNEVLRLTNEAARLLLGYQWPMNVGELRNAILAAAIRSAGDRIEPGHLDESIAGSRTKPVVKTLAQVEKEHICEVLRLAGGNKRETARLLGISHTTLHEKLKTYDLRAVDDATSG
jgi:DNA-binding NtrC family response regulator